MHVGPTISESLAALQLESHLHDSLPRGGGLRRPYAPRSAGFTYEGRLTTMAPQTTEAALMISWVTVLSPPELHRAPSLPIRRAYR